MALSPKTIAYILCLMDLYNFVNTMFTNLAVKNYGEENANEQAVKMYQWYALSFTWTTIPFFCAVKASRNDESKLRRVLTCFAYCTCVNLGAINHAGPQHTGGVFVDSEHKMNTIVMVAMLCLAGMGISSGPSVHTTESLFKMSSRTKIALFLQLLVMTFWFLDVSTLSPCDKYYPGFDVSDKYAYDSNRWFSATPILGSFWIVHTMTYGGTAGQMLLCRWNLVNYVVNEYVIRFTTVADHMPASAVNEGTAMRLVMGGVLCWALFGAEKKKTS